MKILMVNKFFFVKGGSETYYFSLKKLLESKGHSVIDFSMQDDRNFPSEYSKYFVSGVDYNKPLGIKKKIKAGVNIIYSLEAKKKFEQLILDTKPDIIHLHIFQHQLSPSILDVIKKYNLPAVYTAHDLKMLCLNYKMMQHGKICEECKGGRYYCCVKNKCVKNSLLKSSINMVEGYLHEWRKSYAVIDRIITPSEFYRNKFIEFGIKAERVSHISNFLDAEKPQISLRIDREKYYLYFGRLSEEKGVLTLLKSFKNISETLYIVGTGPIKEQAIDFIKVNNMSNVKILGFMTGQELKEIVGNAKAIILPSEWYENGPYSAIEALQLGRPIIGANIGGIPELIVNNGFLFESGNADDLTRQIKKMSKTPMRNYNEMKIASETLFTNCYTAEIHYKQLKKIYQEAMRDHEK